MPVAASGAGISAGAGAGVRPPSTGATRNPGSQAALRELNEQRIIAALVAVGAATQVEISNHTGLSAATVSNIVKTMTERGVLITTPTTRSGRRALSVSLNAKGAVAVGIDFGRRHVRIVLAGRGHTLLAERSITLPPGYGPTVGIAAAADLLEELLAEQAVPSSAVVGVGVGIPGPIDRRSWTVVPGVSLPEWAGLPILDEIQRRVRFPLHLDNDANLGALAQVTWGPHQDVENLVFIKIGSGIGCGMILNGAPFYGQIGVTGEIGHTAVDTQGPVCRCGNRGCLERVASMSTMIDQLSQGSATRLGAADIVRSAREGDPATLRVLEDAGVAVGRALSVVANLLNPEVIVIGGPLAELDDLLLDPIRHGLERHAIPIVGATTSVVTSPLGERAEALGAAALVLQRPVVPPAW